MPQLCSLLAKVGTENEPRPEQLVGALYVLGCMGKPAVPALAEVQAATRARGLIVRCTNDGIAIAPPLIINQSQCDQIAGGIADALT